MQCLRVPCFPLDIPLLLAYTHVKPLVAFQQHKLRSFSQGCLESSKAYGLLCWSERSYNAQVSVYSYFMQRCKRGSSASLFPRLAYRLSYEVPCIV